MRRREVIAGLGALAFTGALAARAQQPARAHRMAIAHPAAPTSDMTQAKLARMFFEELRKRGYVEGRNLTVELYSARGQTERYAQFAAEVVSRNPDVILTFTTRMLRHFMEVTATIPVVGMTGDPGLGLVASLARPGGNLTGVVTAGGFVIWEKLLEIVGEIRSASTPGRLRCASALSKAGARGGPTPGDHAGRLTTGNPASGRRVSTRHSKAWSGRMPTF